MELLPLVVMNEFGGCVKGGYWGRDGCKSYSYGWFVKTGQEGRIGHGSNKRELLLEIVKLGSVLSGRCRFSLYSSSAWAIAIRLSQNSVTTARLDCAFFIESGGGLVSPSTWCCSTLPCWGYGSWMTNHIKLSVSLLLTVDSFCLEDLAVAGNFLGKVLAWTVSQQPFYLDTGD